MVRSQRLLAPALRLLPAEQDTAGERGGGARRRSRDGCTVGHKGMEVGVKKRHHAGGWDGARSGDANDGGDWRCKQASSGRDETRADLRAWLNGDGNADRKLRQTRGAELGGTVGRTGWVYEYVLTVL